jgi:tetratricopeptide (TPR) repeat protein
MSGLSGFSSDPSNPISVNGDNNQVIGQNFGNAFGNVENVYLNQQPKFLSLHQLSFDIDFTGREADIQTIRQLSIDGTSVAISGMAGVGKSALAIHVAQQLAESDFPDVQLYIDLRGADGDGLDPAEVLAGFLRAFGLDESNIPRDLQERSRLYRSQLAGKRSIVLLDNAQDEAQVRPLLPGNGCAVIITSRRVLGALAAQSIPLKVLSVDDARDLLAKSIGMTRLEAEPQAAAEILRLCDGLPLAILIAGGTLKSKRHWSLAEYSQKLSDERQRLERLQLSDLSVRASFELSYRELSATDGLLFGKLGILVGKDFGKELAAVVHDADSPVIDGIERLIDAQLLEVNIDRRYRFHDLLRLFAREKLDESTSVEEQEEIKLEIVNWCYKQSDIRHCLLVPSKRHQIVKLWIENGEAPADFDEQYLIASTLDWFDLEREHLLSAIDWAEDEKCWNLVMSLVSNLLSFFQARSYWQEWEKACLATVNAASQSGNRHWISQSLNNLGMAYRIQSRWTEAIDCYQKSLAIYRELGDRQGEGQSLNNLGNAYGSLHRGDDAVECFQHSLTIKHQLGDRPGEANIFNNLGNIYKDQKRWDEAIDCFQRSLTIFRELGDRYREGGTLNNLGSVYLYQNRWDEAIDCFQKSLIICRSFRDLYIEAQILNNFGMLYRTQQQWDKAINFFQQSLSIRLELGDKYGEAQTLSHLGILYEESGQLNLAISFWQEALIKFPKDAPDCEETEKWLENALNIKTKTLG